MTERRFHAHFVLSRRQRCERAWSSRLTQCRALELTWVHKTPGLLLAIAGASLAASISPHGWKSAACWLLIISGLAFAGTGVFPAEMRDGAVLVASASTRGHFIMSLIHGIAWVIGAALLVAPMKRSADWRGWHIAHVALVVLVLVALFSLRGRLSDALVQRVAGLLYFAWFFVLSLRLFQLRRHSNVTAAA